MSAASWIRLLGLSVVVAAVALILPAWTQPPAGKKVVKGWDKEITNSIGMKLVRIPPGKFKMGSPPGEKDRSDDEQQHDVEITKEFWLGIHEVTQKQFKAVMGYNPSCFSSGGEAKPGLNYLDWSKPAGGKDKVAGRDTSDFPVENVSWEEAIEFCTKLSAKTGERGRTCRLPTEAEWEYACRGGATSYQTFHFGNSLSSTQANFDGNYPYGDAAKGPFLVRTCKAGSYKPNGFGLYDMCGNVLEWCADWYGEDYYSKSDGAKNPTGPSKGVNRVIRGGGWCHDGLYCRSAELPERSDRPSYRSGGRSRAPWLLQSRGISYKGCCPQNGRRNSCPSANPSSRNSTATLSYTSC